MERLRLKYKDTLRAITTLKEILQELFSIIVRDATIQRFEYTFEALWKFLKEYLKEKEGIICNSPKSCFREAFSVGILKEEETIEFLQMTDDRNMITHTYKEQIAQILYNRIPHYCDLINTLLNRLKI